MTLNVGKWFRNGSALYHYFEQLQISTNTWPETRVITVGDAKGRDCSNREEFVFYTSCTQYMLYGLALENWLKGILIWNSINELQQVFGEEFNAKLSEIPDPLESWRLKTHDLKDLATRANIFQNLDELTKDFLCVLTQVVSYLGRYPVPLIKDAENIRPFLDFENKEEHVRRINKEVGVTADRIWNEITRLGYSSLLSNEE